MARIASMLMAPVFAVVWVTIGPGPKFEEIFVLMTGTAALVVIAVGAAWLRPRAPLGNAAVAGLSCLVLWIGTCARIASMYHYRLLDIPAVTVGIAVSAVLGFVTWATLALVAVAARTLSRGADPDC